MGRAPCCDKMSVKKGPWSAEEDAKLKSHIEKHGTGGNWIALPQKIEGLKRCGKSCRLRWLNYLRPNIKHGGFSEEEDNLICSLYISIGSRWSIIAAQLPGRTDNDIKNYWNTKLKKKLLGDQRKQRTHKRRRVDSLTQEMAKEIDTRGSDDLSIGNITVGNHNISNQMMPYCPAMPSPVPALLRQHSQHNNHEPSALDPKSFDDNNSIRKLLIKLGGRFWDDNHHALLDHLPAISDGSLPVNTGYEQPVGLTSVQSDSARVRASEYCAEDDVRFLPMLEAQQTDCRVNLGYSTNNGYLQEGLGGLEFLSGNDSIMHDNSRLLAVAGDSGSCGPQVGWDELSNFVCAGNLSQGCGTYMN
ncbi:hypothetical protein MLD38_012989 [Melastoma candidum]|uniref:Uncharacterized protein n=1 Tax=Melastoma candidum TaxID=119954 RepID=A0ACB9RCB3_9MYRT|nr:hypothetical protein MLD38_012989 [Melastoma candidum]